MLFWKDVMNGILLDRPLPFKLHQSYRLLRCFIRKKSGRVPRNADSFLLQIPCKKKCGDDGDDLNTAVGISLPRWCGNAVIVTALITARVYTQSRPRGLDKWTISTYKIKIVPQRCTVTELEGSTYPTFTVFQILIELATTGTNFKLFPFFLCQQINILKSIWFNLVSFNHPPWNCRLRINPIMKSLKLERPII